MRYYDYDWDLTANGIVFDEDLDTDKLGWQAGDLFKFVNVNGRQMLVKTEPLAEFIKQGLKKANGE